MLPPALVTTAETQSQDRSTEARDWVPVLFALAAAIAAYWPILTGMWGSWFDDKADMGHGMIVPLAAAYMTSTKWPTMRSLTARPSRWGGLLVVAAGVMAVIGGAAQWLWCARIAFVVATVGCVIGVRGWATARALAYPLGTLLLMVAPPTFVYERLTLPLQLLASRLGEISLEVIGISVLREGNVLELANEKLSVEEACSGIRALIALIFMCVLYNYFFVVEGWMRAVMLALVAPIAIVGNAFRILATGVVSTVNSELAHGALHDVFGYLSVTVAALLCVLLHVCLVQIRKRRLQLA